MYENIARFLTKKLFKLNVLQHESFDVYMYGITLIISTISVLFTIFTTAALIGEIIETTIYLIGFLTTRFLCGGYHAKHFYSCFISTNLTYWLFLTIHSLTRNSDINELLVSLFTFLSLITINIFAPVENYNNPMSNYRKQKNKRYIFLLSIVAFSIMLFLLFFKKQYDIFSPFLLGIFVASLTILLAKIENIFLKSRGGLK